MAEQIAVGGRLVSPDEIDQHHQTTITVLDLLSAIEAQQFEAAETGQWWKAKLEPYQFAIIRKAYRDVDELRKFFQQTQDDHARWLRENSR